MTAIPGLAALSGLKSTVGIIATVVVFSAGVAAGELNEHKAPWGLGRQLTRLEDSVARQVTAAQVQGHRDQLAFDTNIVNTQWRPALAQCQSEKLVASQSEAGYLDEIKAAGAASREAAYRLGTASCKGSLHASTSTGQRSSTSVVGVRDAGDIDLRDTLAGAAYTAPAH